MAGISSKAAGKLETKKKYNSYEFNSDFDINIYESLYRSHDAQIGRFWQLDPKPNEFESLYAAMGNNPIRNFDILGDTLKSEQDKTLMKNVVTSVNDKITELKKDTENKTKKKEEGKLSKRENKKLTKKIDDLNDRISSLEATLVQIDNLIKDKNNGYSFSQLGEGAKAGFLFFEKDGTVNINYMQGGYEQVIHEIDHADAYRLGIIKPGEQLPTLAYKISVSRYDYEASAFRKQYGYDNNSVPRSDNDSGLIKSINEINGSYIKGIDLYKNLQQ